MSPMMDARTKKRMRFAVLELIYKQHERQLHRYDDVTLTGVLARLGQDVYVDLMRALLQDMKERELIAYEDSKDWQTGKFRIFHIEIRPKGRDLVEANEDNPLAEV